MTFTKMDIHLQDFYIKSVINGSINRLNIKTIDEKNKDLLYKHSVNGNVLMNHINKYNELVNDTNNIYNAYSPLIKLHEYDSLMSMCQMNLDGLGGLNVAYNTLTQKETEQCKTLIDLCEQYIKHQTSKLINEIAKENS